MKEEERGKARAEAGLQSRFKGISPTEDRKWIEGFIYSQVTGRGLDERTEKAYRQDLEHFICG